ncbi:YraN family protein [Cnuibacter sp. UC19_7]|uniref:YraN family protein n=1 Tax=Cnuibacter sp. UC19_7 TaxID=3350166 RepID=UPI0036703465
MRAKDTLGRRGEQAAADHLVAQGLEILDRNWRCEIGEIDIVALDGETVVVVEVKTRSTSAFGHPFEAINGEKLVRLHQLGRRWRVAHPDHRRRRMRVDVVGVLWPGSEARIERLIEVA